MYNKITKIISNSLNEVLSKYTYNNDVDDTIDVDDIIDIDEDDEDFINFIQSNLEEFINEKIDFSKPSNFKFMCTIYALKYNLDIFLNKKAQFKIVDNITKRYLTWLQKNYPTECQVYNITNKKKYTDNFLACIVIAIKKYINLWIYLDQMIQIKKNQLRIITPEGFKTFNYKYLYIPFYRESFKSGKIDNMSKNDIFYYNPYKQNQDLPQIWFTNNKQQLLSILKSKEYDPKYCYVISNRAGTIYDTIYDFTEPNNIKNPDTAKFNIMKAWICTY